MQVNTQTTKCNVDPFTSCCVYTFCIWKNSLQVRNSSSVGSMHLAVALRAKLPGPRQTAGRPGLTPQESTSSAALFSNFALKYAAVLNPQRLSAWLAVSLLKCRVCLTFLERFCNRGKRLSWPHSVISGTLPAWYSVLHSAGFITLEADTLVAR